MANPVEHYLKLLIGDLVITVAKLQAEYDAVPPPTPPSLPTPPAADGRKAKPDA